MRVNCYLPGGYIEVLNKLFTLADVPIFSKRLSNRDFSVVFYLNNKRLSDL